MADINKIPLCTLHNVWYAVPDFTRLFNCSCTCM